MIYIKEDRPQKVSGLTSLFISFNYNKIIVDAIKGIEGGYYHKKTYEWEFPIISLSSLLDKLTYLDDIKLQLYNEPKKEDLVPILKYKTKPFPYQLEGIKYGLTHDKWLLLDAPGLGKTLQIIYIAEELKAQKGIKHCLIVCGVASLKTNWKMEIEKHSNFKCKILGEYTTKKGTTYYKSIPDRIKELEEDIEEFFIITNIETFRTKKRTRTITRGVNKGVEVNEEYCPIIETLNNSPIQIDMIAFDEAHTCKNINSNQCQGFIKLNAPYKIAATGTLLLNNPLDAYVPLRWTDNEKSTLSEFESTYCVYGGFGGHAIVGFKNTSLLKEELEGCSLRRRKEDVLKDLPPKTVIKEYLDLDDNHARFYEAVRDGVKEECDKIKLNTVNLLGLVTRLRQATVSPSILTTQNIKSSKIERCIDLVKQLVDQGEKVVVMSTFKESLREVEAELNYLNPLVCTGDSKTEEIDLNKKLFQEDDNYKVLLATWKKMGTGHTLNKASYMIFLDTPWTFGVFDQACDRIHRIGSQNPVIIYNLIASNTIDEKVADILDRKKAISDFIIDDDLDDDSLDILRKYIEDL